MGHNPRNMVWGRETGPGGLWNQIRVRRKAQRPVAKPLPARMCCLLPGLGWTVGILYRSLYLIPQEDSQDPAFCLVLGRNSDTFLPNVFNVQRHRPDFLQKKGCPLSWQKPQVPQLGQSSSSAPEQSRQTQVHGPPLTGAQCFPDLMEGMIKIPGESQSKPSCVGAGLSPVAFQ